MGEEKIYDKIYLKQLSFICFFISWLRDQMAITFYSLLNTKERQIIFILFVWFYFRWVSMTAFEYLLKFAKPLLLTRCIYF